MSIVRVLPKGHGKRPLNWESSRYHFKCPEAHTCGIRRVNHVQRTSCGGYRYRDIHSVVPLQRRSDNIQAAFTERNSRVLREVKPTPQSVTALNVSSSLILMQLGSGLEPVHTVRQ